MKLLLLWQVLEIKMIPIFGILIIMEVKSGNGGI